MFFVRRLILWVAVVAAGLQSGWASNWRIFKMADGLAQSFVSTVSIGYTNVVVGHSEVGAVSLVNGYNARAYRAPPLGNSRIYESRAGQLWAAFPDGLQEFTSGLWTAHPVREIQAEFQTNLVRRARSVSLVPLRQNHVLFLVSDQLAEYSHESGSPEVVTVRHVDQTKLGRFADMTQGRNGTLWISGDKGLLRATGLTPSGVRIAELQWTEFLVPEELGVRDLQQPLADDDGGVTVVGELRSTHRRIAVHFDGANWMALPPGRENFRQAWRGVDGVFWASTISAIYKLQPGTTQFVELDEISAGQYFDVATDTNGVFWVATSDGLFRYTPALWRLPSELQPSNASVQGLVVDANGALWMMTADSLGVYNGEAWKKYALPESIEKRFPALDAMFALPNGWIVIESLGHLVCFDPVAERFSTISHPSGRPVNVLGLAKGGMLTLEVLDGDRSKAASHIELFNGTQFQPFSGAQPPVTNSMAMLFVATVASGDIWLGTSSGLFRCRDNKWQSYCPTDGSTPDIASCMVEAGEGRLWFGARDRLWEFDGLNWTVIRGGLDRVNSLVKTHDGSIWVASNNGLHRFYKGVWMMNSVEDGLPSAALLKVLEDPKGRIWAVTVRGLSLYHPMVDPHPPNTFIQKKTLSADGECEIGFSGVDKWKLSSPESLLFSWRLDEQDWSQFQSERTVSFPQLSGGKHFFQVRAMDRNGNIDSTPALLEFEIPVPWYKEARLVLISIIGVGGIVFFAGLAFNRHRRLVRSYAEVESMVAVRTRQLEQVNAQLLHSQKMNALGTLSAGVAHDFNNILSIIKGSAQIIGSNLDDHDKIKTRLERISTVVEQGSGIVKAMLGFSRPADAQLPRCNLNTVAGDTIKLLGDRFLREIEVRLEGDWTLPEMPLARDFLQQILLNFIFNAADATTAPGQIVLQTGRRFELPSTVVLNPAPAETYLFVSVRDFGCGIAPEIMPRIFEPFFTTKAFSTRRGTGLGLSMVYQMAQEMQWGLMVESTIGRGTTFTVLIPAPKSDIKPA